MLRPDRWVFASAVVLMTASCTTQTRLGEPPALEPVQASAEYTAMATPAFEFEPDPLAPAQVAPASLWTGDRGSLLGDRRAMQRGDILTVVIEITSSRLVPRA